MGDSGRSRRGLGDLGIRYGHQCFMSEVMAAVVLVLIVLVQGVQSLGKATARRPDKRGVLSAIFR